MAHHEDYSPSTGFNDFIICLRYKGYVIKEYFANYCSICPTSPSTTSNSMEVHHRNLEPWRVTLVNTERDTPTARPLKRVRSHPGDEPFCLTYWRRRQRHQPQGAGRLPQGHGKLATVTAIQPPGRYGALEIEQDAVVSFREKLHRGRAHGLTRRLFRGAASAGHRLHRRRPDELGCATEPLIQLASSRN